MTIAVDWDVKTKQKYRNLVHFPVPFNLFNLIQGVHRLEKYLNIKVCLEKSLKIKFALKST